MGVDELIESFRNIDDKIVKHHLRNLSQNDDGDTPELDRVTSEKDDELANERAAILKKVEAMYEKKCNRTCMSWLCTDTKRCTELTKLKNVLSHASTCQAKNNTIWVDEECRVCHEITGIRSDGVQIV